ncbi:MAG: phosphate ABC transporter substrate-binding protein [Anaerovoracaceae bacterium]
MKKKLLTGIIATVVLVTAVVGLSGCGKSSSSAEKGSTVTLAGSTSVQPLTEAFGEKYMEDNPDVTIEAQGGGSGQGVKAIETNIADIGSLSREVKEEEKTALKKEYVIAQDGVAVVVNSEVKVDNLSMDQIMKIYTGKIKNWKEVGGTDKEITAVTREEGSGTRGAFTEITGVLTKDDAGTETDNTTSKALVQPSTGAVKETVAKTPNSIGYMSIGALDDTVKAVKVDKVDATEENVLAKKYPISRPFLYAVGSEVTKEAQAFIDFALSQEGQKIVKESGFIPVK